MNSKELPREESARILLNKESARLVKAMVEIGEKARISADQLLRAFRFGQAYSCGARELMRCLRRGFCVKARLELEQRPWSVVLRWRAMKAFAQLRSWELKQ